ncbi:serine arginine-rich splicing factor [Mortierella antarctica]|nr:serine arginine-rich splicing factor [Mortierella alpina]KAF9990334.1 serine arginine-rich splicing factor [Mortierella antarctica]KAF9990344.1 serine arginine-rich splicing factor [Mortierella antarctica]
MSTRVYLGRLSRDASDRDVESLFKSYGRLREVTLKNGFGFVEFSDPRDAKDAVYDTHGKEFLGERLVVELARGDRRGDRRDDRERDDRRFRPPERTEHRLIVENLAHGVSWQDIKDMMRKAGEVTFADISRDDERQGVVEFSSAEDVENALKTLNGEDLRGNPVTLREFDPSRDTAPRDMGRGGGGGGRDGGRGGRDHGRDRDRRRSRSRSRDRGGDRYRRHSRSRSRDRRDRDRRRSRSRSHGRRDGSRDRRSGRGGRRSRSRSPAPKDRSPAPRDRSPAPRDRSPERERTPVRERTPARERTPSRERMRSASPITSPVARRSRSRSASRD